MLLQEDRIINGIKLKVVRDDIFPFIGGGNKGRKAIYYEEHLVSNGYNAVVTTGGIQSNHCRAIALLAAKHGWPCHLVYHGTQSRFEKEKGNALIVRMTGATYEFVESDGISKAMDISMEHFQAQGYRPYYVTGGGHDLPGGIAFVEAVEELCRQVGDWVPDYVFHASGTGSTQSGILTGLEKIGWSQTKVIGISVARQLQRGTDVIDTFDRLLTDHYGMPPIPRSKIHFNVDYLFGGYEKYTDEMADYLLDVSRKNGLLFDTTYSGKAFFGMMDYIKKNNIKGNILFWHTGGLMNLQR